MSSVQIRDVRKSFGGFEVLHGVSIPIEDGAFVFRGTVRRSRRCSLLNFAFLKLDLIAHCPQVDNH